MAPEAAGSRCLGNYSGDPSPLVGAASSCCLIRAGFLSLTHGAPEG